MKFWLTEGMGKANYYIGYDDNGSNTGINIEEL